MKIADSINIIVDGELVTLRPTLYCAMRLERHPGSFQRIARDIMDGSLTVTLDIIEPHCDFSREYLGEVILPHLDVYKPFLLQYVTACAGIDEDDKKPPQTAKPSSAPSLSYSEYLLSLYRIGTGWLGWTPEQTLDATPAEISEAQRGRLEMLKAIFGSSDKAPAAKDDRPLDEKVRSIFARRDVTVETAE